MKLMPTHCLSQRHFFLTFKEDEDVSELAGGQIASSHGSLSLLRGVSRNMYEKGGVTESSLASTRLCTLVLLTSATTEAVLFSKRITGNEVFISGRQAELNSTVW